MSTSMSFVASTPAFAVVKPAAAARAASMRFSPAPRPVVAVREAAQAAIAHRAAVLVRAGKADPGYVVEVSESLPRVFLPVDDTVHCQ